jgi:putative salt-induced outer membrane protein YdiY
MKRVSTGLSVLFCISLFIIFRTGASADEIILVNGDRLTGVITNAEEGVVTLETEYSEPIKIQKATIKRITTDNPKEIHLMSGEVLKGRLTTTDDGRMVVESYDKRESTALAWDTVTAINPPPDEPSRWKGSVTLGAGLQSGNTDRATVSLGAEATRRTEQDRFGLRFLHNYAEEDDEITARNTYGALKYDYFITKVLYGYLGVELLNDKFKDLNLRTVVGPGFGYQVWDDPVKSLLFEAGLAYFSEDLKEGEDEQWITARLASNFSYRILDTVVFTDQLVIYPNLEDIGQYQLRNESALTSILGSGWSLKLANILERDSDPPEGVKKHDLYWITGLQYGFE